MTDKRNILKEKFIIECGWGKASIRMLADDASFRKYYRLKMGGKTSVLMDAPPPLENVEPFIKVSEYLIKNGFNAPEILFSDIKNGFLLIKDLGDDIMNKAIIHYSELEEEDIYKKTVDTLLDLHQCSNLKNIDKYTDDLLLEEVNLLTSWYLPNIINNKSKLLQATEEYKNIWLDMLPLSRFESEVTILRDFHSDNLMILPKGELGLLDFQDAVIGSPAYDLASLLEDARRDVPVSLAEKMLQYYIDGRSGNEFNSKNFIQSYRILAAQRNCKIIGIFTRLAIRDNKSHYLSLLPRVWRYLEKDVNYPPLSPLKNWLDKYIPQEKHTLTSADISPQQFHKYVQ